MMRRWIAALGISLSLLAWHTEAHAACTTNTTILPNGQVMICTSCCTEHGGCQTICS